MDKFDCWFIFEAVNIGKRGTMEAPRSDSFCVLVLFVCPDRWFPCLAMSLITGRSLTVSIGSSPCVACLCCFGCLCCCCFCFFCPPPPLLLFFCFVCPPTPVPLLYPTLFCVCWSISSCTLVGLSFFLWFLSLVFDRNTSWSFVVFVVFYLCILSLFLSSLCFLRFCCCSFVAF